MSRYRILVCDDDPDIRYVVCGLLSLDFEMVQAENGLDALEKIERYEPDLILLDANMPVMDGYSTCTSIRKAEQFQDLPVFFLTGASSDESRKRAQESGCQGYFEKPFETSELVGGIRTHFTQHRQPPRFKTFNLRELKQIDATPLRASRPVTVSAGAEQRLHESRVVELEPELQKQPPPSEQAPAGEKQRRVFGVGSKPKTAPPISQLGGEEDSEQTAKLVDLHIRINKRLQEGKDSLIPPLGEAARSESPAPALTPPERKAAPPPAPPSPPTRPIPPPVPALPSPPPRAPLPRPVEPPAAGAPAPQASGPQPAAKPAHGSDRPRVLCLIDERAELGEYMTGLKGVAEFLPLEDPVEAVEVIARFQPDIVFLRVQSDKYSGIQIAQLLQGNPRLSHIEVVFFGSGRENAALLDRAKRLSRNQGLHLPVSSGQVKEILERIKGRTGFAVREKKLSYGVYVKEVIQAARHEEEAQRKHMEKEAFRRQHDTLAGYMAKAFQGDQPAAPPEGADPSAKVRRDYYVQ